jgi:uncharacterized protein YkwD
MEPSSVARISRRLAFVAALAGCAPPPFGPDPAAPRGSSADDTHANADLSNDPPPSTPSYATDIVPGSAVDTSDAGRLIERVVLRLLRERGAAPAPDARLVPLGVWGARFFAKSGTMPEAIAIDDVAHRLGHVGGSVPGVLVMRGFASTEEVIEPELRALIEKQPTNLPITRYAIARTPTNGPDAYGIVIDSLEIALEPVPKHASRDATLHLAGHVADRFDHVHLVVAAPSGAVRAFDPSRSFATDVHLEQAGIYRVDIYGVQGDGQIELANFPVYVDAEEPPLRLTHAAEVASLTAPEMEQRLLTLLNEARTQANLAPLATDDTLMSYAREHSQDMADHDYIGDDSPTLGTLTVRVRRAHLMGAQFMEWSAGGNSAEDVNTRTLESAGARAVLLQKAFTRVGVGVVIQSRNGDQPTYLVSYLLAQQ